MTTDDSFGSFDSSIRRTTGAESAGMMPAAAPAASAVSIPAPAGSGAAPSSASGGPDSVASADTVGLTRSLAYARAMGIGWNLGNSFDAVGDNAGNAVTLDYAAPDPGTRAWRNPAPTRDLIHAIAAKGYTTLRVPFTLLRRFHGQTAADGTEHWVIDPAWLHAYRQVVDWALAEGLHVVVNIHHDSWLWLARWHGDTSAMEYRAFRGFWDQLARAFADEPDALAFETINEPRFVGKDGVKIEDDAITQPFIDAINKAAYDAIRAVPGNEHRMVILTTLDTGFDPHSRLAALRDFITKDLHDDPDVLATVHYYSEWVYSGSLGRTGFDEPFRAGSPDTPRTHLARLASALDEYFTREGIGTFIGEWGLLGYDTASDGALQQGEELKYYDAFLAMVRDHGFACTFWDNGTGIDRTDAAHGYPWRKPLVGAVMHAGLTGRSACAAGPDTVYVGGPDAADPGHAGADRPTVTPADDDTGRSDGGAAGADIRVPLVLSGHHLLSVRDGRGRLAEGDQYRLEPMPQPASDKTAGRQGSSAPAGADTPTAAGASAGPRASTGAVPEGAKPEGDIVLVLSSRYVRGLQAAKGADGLLADLVLHFDGGADWHEYLVQAGRPALLTGPTSIAAAQAVVTHGPLPEDGLDQAADDRAAALFHHGETTPAFWVPVRGTRTDGITVPLRFAGNELKSVAARTVRAGLAGTAADPRDTWLGPQSGYWDMLQNGGAYTVRYDDADRLTGSITLLPAFFDCPGVRAASGPIVLFVRFQSGALLRVPLVLDAEGAVRLG